MIGRIGVTGSRFPLDRRQSKRLLEVLTGLREPGARQEFHHGCCTGADAYAARAAKALGFVVVGHPPTEAKHLDRPTVLLCDELRPAATYMARNDRIVAESDLVLGAPLSPVEDLRSGTWSTLRRARDARLVTVVIGPSGETVHWPVRR